MTLMKKYLFFSLMFFLVSCSGSLKKDRKATIMVTIQPQYYFTEALAHGYYHVACMVPQGSSPETYDPTPHQLVELSKSIAYLRIGYIGFERNWIDRLFANAPHLEFFETSQGLDLILETTKNTKVMDHNINIIEPHVWCSTKNAKIIVENTYRFISSLDKQHDKIYLARFDSLQKVISKVDSTLISLLSQPTADHSFAIYHPSLSYFARDYGLTQISIEHNGKEPSPSELQQIINNCKEAHVRIIFIQPEFDRHNAEVIAKEIGAKVVSINPLNRDWDKEMISIAQALCGNNKLKQ